MADQSYTLDINGETHTVRSSPDTPLLYVLIDELNLQGPRFGCGMAQCGACSVLANGEEIRSCVTPVSAVAGMPLTTLEGLPGRFAQGMGLERPPRFTPLQEAMVEHQAVQCGYCFNGMLIKATELLENTPDPSEEQIRRHMNGHLCRCGTYPRIISAIQAAAAKIRGMA